MSIALMLTAALVAAPSDSSELPAAPERIDVKVKGSVEASLNRVVGARTGAALAAQAARLIRWRGDIIRDPRRGDGLTVLWEPGEEGPELVALRYQGERIVLDAYRFVGADGVPRYYDADGALVEPALAHSPAPGYHQITEVMQRGRGKRRHNGIDLKGPEGLPIVLPQEAVVQRVNWSTRVNGNCVEVRYRGDGPLAGKLGRFLHLVDVDPGMKGGARLPAGTRVGGLGNTGRSTAPHLHYEIRGKGGKPLSPLKTHGSQVVTVPPEDAARYQSIRARLDARLDGLPYVGPAPGDGLGTLALPPKVPAGPTLRASSPQEPGPARPAAK